MGDTCRVSILGKNFKGKVSKSQRKQITKCKIEKLKNTGKKIVKDIKDLKPIIRTRGGDTISIRNPIIRKQNK
jgi:uncharacterized protein (UPF0335 family)